VRDYVFDMAPSFVDRHDPTTWVDPPFVGGLHNLAGKTTSKDGRSGDWGERSGPPFSAGYGFFSEGRKGKPGSSWKIMSPTPKASGESYGGDVFGVPASGLGAEPWLLELTANHPHMRSVVTQLVGGPIRMCQRTRGIYTIWPTTDHTERTVGGKSRVDHYLRWWLHYIAYVLSEHPVDSRAQ
jgi:hypothetical protein